MEKLGPGRDADTLRVLNSLPRRQFDLVVDAGCGAGRQTIALAKALRTTIHAVDSNQSFQDELARRTEQSGVVSLIEAHCMDMRDVPTKFTQIELLWCEGAAYNIGFANALGIWAPAIRPGGFAVVSELAWIKESAPIAARNFFLSGYPGMQHSAQNILTAEAAGYVVLETYTLPREAWIERYYEVLEPRATALSTHPTSAVRELASETLKEIAIFKSAEESYGYVFYILQRRT